MTVKNIFGINRYSTSIISLPTNFLCKLTLLTPITTTNYVDTKKLVGWVSFLDHLEQIAHGYTPTIYFFAICCTEKDNGRSA